MRGGVVVRLLVPLMPLALALEGCSSDDGVVVLGDTPAAPRALNAFYYAGAVTVEWELAPDWDDDAFRIYSRRVTDADFFFIAEVTSCAEGLCSYQDWNVVSGETYEYYVSAVDPDSGIETASDETVEVEVPDPTPPPVPTAPAVVALDGATFLVWADNARVEDFSHYRVYQDAGGTSYLLGETDSEGFLDLLAQNGQTYSYFVTALDIYGHESDGTVTASGTPRPDFHDEFMFAHGSDASMSGFRFVADEGTVPVISGSDPGRHFRFEADASGWWLVPNGGTQIHEGIATTALKCGPGADVDCVDVSVAPSSGFTNQDVAVGTGTSYVMRVVGDDGLTHYGVIRVVHVGLDQNGKDFMVFEWAYQLQPNNPSLAPPQG